LKLLIVDDEYYSVEGLYLSVDWTSLGIDEVLKAYSMQQAQQIFQTKKIDILISDIEMPKGSGLDLLKWIRENNYTTVTIFLTAYANFDYASNAIKLQSTDYLLKPVDSEKLKECLLNAIQKVKQMELYELNKANAKYWNDNKKKLEEQFWINLCTQIIPEDTVQILRELNQYHLPSSLYNDSFFIGLLEAYIKRSEVQWEINLYEYAIRNIITEIWGVQKINVIFTRLDEQHYFICMNKNEVKDKAQFLNLCHLALDALHKSLPGIFKIYAGNETTLLTIGRRFQELIKTARSNLSEECKIIDTTAPQVKKNPPKLISMEEWPDMLVKHKKLEVRKKAIQYLYELKKSNTADRNDLLRFYHDFMQIIYTILEKNGESAHLLFSDSSSVEIFEQACNSFEDMIKWVTHVTDVLDKCLITISQSASSVETVKKYIREHVNEDLTRKKLASIVYLSPDYLSHVFRETTGESLSSFILSERIKKAKELLLYSNMNICDIALATGFSNISYFSRQFKSLTGMTPQEFRKK